MFEIFKRLFKRKEKPMLKLGLALGSGGAKGLAHLGVLSAFEEENITFDYIAGTSIGSIVGALLSSGYNSRDISALLDSFDIKEIKRLVMIRMSGMNIEKAVGSIIGDMQFSDLKTPFKAVAVDIDTGTEVVLEEGSVAKAVSASSAVAPFFRPVKYDDMSLIDGAYLNSVPCDVVKEMGADFVIGVNLGAFNRKNAKEGKSILDELFPKNRIASTNSSRKGYRYADFMIEPHLENYKGTQFNKASEMYEIGYACAKENMPAILEAIKARSEGNVKRSKKTR